MSNSIPTTTVCGNLDDPEAFAFLNLSVSKEKKV